MGEPLDTTKIFLDYLDKEMTIMGLLSTFCVAASALVIDRVGSAERTSVFGRIAIHHPVEAFIGSGTLMIASLCFYLQRSWLAHLYGSICASMVVPATSSWDSRRWVAEACTYATWLRYRAGFLFLTATFLFYTHVIYRELYPTSPPRTLWLVVLLISLAGAMACQFVVLSTHRYSNQPYRDFSLKTLRRDWKRRHQPPNH